MKDQIEKLQSEIEEIERQIAAHPFGGLLNRKHTDQLLLKLKKKRKELARLEGGGSTIPPVAEHPPEPAQTKKQADPKKSAKTPEKARASAKSTGTTTKKTGSKPAGKAGSAATKTKSSGAKAPRTTGGKTTATSKSPKGKKK